MDLDFPLIVYDVYAELLDTPEGTYGMSYDVYTRRTEDNPPFGWNSARCKLSMGQSEVYEKLTEITRYSIHLHTVEEEIKRWWLSAIAIF